MKYFHVKLVRMKGNVLIAPEDEEIRLFSSMEAVEKWLLKNGFVYGQRSFFNYEPASYNEWFHKDDISMEYINVSITKIKIDDFSRSLYKKLKKIHFKWLSKEFAEEMLTDQASKHKIIE